MFAQARRDGERAAVDQRGRADQILENLKIDLAKRYLADEDLSISQIAWLLGYQEVSSLTHAFKRWTGKTPQQERSRTAA